MMVTFDDNGDFDNGYDDSDDGDFEGDGNDDSTNQVYNLSKLTDWRTAYGIGKYNENTIYIQNILKIH